MCVGGGGGGGVEEKGIIIMNQSLVVSHNPVFRHKENTRIVADNCIISSVVLQ